MRNSKISPIMAMVIIITGILGFAFSLLAANIPDNDIVSRISGYAIRAGDSQRVASVGYGRLEAEELFIIKRLKSVTPFLALVLFLWGMGWLVAIRKAASESCRAAHDGARYITAGISPLALAIVITGALLLRIIQFDQSLWVDEIHAYMSCIDAGFLKIFTYNNQILHSVLARVLLLLCGNKEWALRLPALIFGMAGIWGVSKLAGLLGRKDVIWISILFLALSPLHVDQSQQVRSYTMLFFFSAMSCYYFLRCLRDDKRAVWFGFAAASIAGLWSHPYMSMVLISQFICVAAGCLFIRDNRETTAPAVSWSVVSRFFLVFTIIGAITFVIYAPSLPFFLFESLRDYPRRVVSLKFVGLIIRELGSGAEGPDLGMGHLIFFITGLFFMRRREKMMALLGTTVMVAPIVLNAIMRPNWLYPRFFMYALPLYLVFAAYGICAITEKLTSSRQIAARTAFAILLFAVSAASLFRIATEPRQDYRRAAVYIRGHTDKDTVVISPGFAGSEIGYYLKGYRVVNAKTLAEVEKAWSGNRKAIFFVTYDSDIPSDVMGFIKGSCREAIEYPSRLSPVAVYMKP